MTLVTSSAQELAIKDLAEEIRLAHTILGSSRVARQRALDIKTHIRGPFGTGKYVRLPHWEIEDVLPEFELPRSWKLFDAFLQEGGQPAFWLPAGHGIAMNKRSARGVMTTTHLLPLKLLSVQQIDELNMGVHHLQRLAISS